MHSELKKLFAQMQMYDFVRDTKNFSLAYSCKIDINNVDDERGIIACRKQNIRNILKILELIGCSTKIKKWVLSHYHKNMRFYISFDKNLIKIYCEKDLIDCIFWEKGDQENYKSRQYTKIGKKPEDYTDLIYPEFNKYLDFKNCHVRYQTGIEEYNVYIRSARTSKHPPIFSEQVKLYCCIMLARYQEDLAKNDPQKFEENLKTLNTSLSMYIEKGLKFNWLQVNKNNFTVYVF
jgi:hypothetical protein